jgi:hypothetical protein
LNEGEDACGLLAGEPEGKRLLGRPRCRLVNNIDLCIWLNLGTVMGPCEHGSELLGSIKYLEVLEWLCSWSLLGNGSAAWNLQNKIFLVSLFKHYNMKVHGEVHV